MGPRLCAARATRGRGENPRLIGFVGAKRRLRSIFSAGHWASWRFAISRVIPRTFRSVALYELHAISDGSLEPCFYSFILWRIVRSTFLLTVRVADQSGSTSCRK